MGPMDDFAIWLTAIGSIATAAFTGLLWWAALRTLGGAKDQLKLLREQSELEGRPYVTLDVVPGFHGPGNWDLVLANNGRTAANNLRFEFDKWAPKGHEDHITGPLQDYLSTTHTLAPGSRRRLLWRSEEVSQSSQEAAGADKSQELAVTYQDARGKTYTDTFAFDVEVLGPVSPAPTEGPSKLGSGKELADINLAIRALSHHVGELRR